MKIAPSSVLFLSLFHYGFGQVISRPQPVPTSTSTTATTTRTTTTTTITNSPTITDVSPVTTKPTITRFPQPTTIEEEEEETEVSEVAVSNSLNTQKILLIVGIVLGVLVALALSCLVYNKSKHFFEHKTEEKNPNLIEINSQARSIPPSNQSNTAFDATGYSRSIVAGYPEDLSHYSDSPYYPNQNYQAYSAGNVINQGYVDDTASYISTSHYSAGPASNFQPYHDYPENEGGPYVVHRNPYEGGKYHQ